MLSSASSDKPHYGDSRRYNRSTSFAENLERNTHFLLFAQQFYAMFVKRALHTLRNKIVTFVQLAVPFFFTIVSLIVIKTFPGPHDSPSLNLTISSLGENVVVYSLPANVSNHSVLWNMGHFYGNQFEEGVGTKVKLVNKEKGFKEKPDIVNFLLSRGQESIGDYNLHYMVGANFEHNEGSTDGVTITAYFNDQAYHTPAITIGVLANSLMQYFFNDTKMSIEATNHPLPRTNNQKLDDEMTKETTGFTLAFNIVFGMSFLASSFSLFLVKERSTKAKHLQFTSGVRLFTFWSATFCWDMINYLMTALCLILTIVFFDVEAYVVKDHAVHTTLLFLFYGFAMLPFMYLWSFVFTVPATGYVWLTMFNILSGSILKLTSSIVINNLIY